MLTLKPAEPQVPRMYDAMSDTFISDRAKIIDNLVEGAARLLTFTERQAPSTFGIDDKCRALFRSAIAEHGRARHALRHLVRTGWLAWVIRE